MNDEKFEKYKQLKLDLEKQENLLSIFKNNEHSIYFTQRGNPYSMVKSDELFFRKTMIARISDRIFHLKKKIEEL